MASADLRKRLEVLENEVERLRQAVEAASTKTPWWEAIAGSFADDPAFDQAMRLGRQYRRSGRAATRGSKRGHGRSGH